MQQVTVGRVDFDCLDGGISLDGREGGWGGLTSKPALSARWVAARKDCLRLSMSSRVIVCGRQVCSSYGSLLALMTLFGHPPTCAAGQSGIIRGKMCKPSYLSSSCSFAINPWGNS